jgi:hypothetical protein
MPFQQLHHLVLLVGDGSTKAGRHFLPRSIGWCRTPQHSVGLLDETIKSDLGFGA